MFACPVDVTRRAAAYRNSGWTGFDGIAGPFFVDTWQTIIPGAGEVAAF